MGLGAKAGPLAFIQWLGDKCLHLTSVTSALGLGGMVAPKGLVKET